MQDDTDFIGAKLILFLGPRLLVLRRDNLSTIPWPDYLDFPGGGREGGESAEDCVRRETFEEVGLVVPAKALIWKNPQTRPKGRSWFFAACLPASDAQNVRFGDEGQGWQLISPQQYLSASDAIPYFKDQLQSFLATQA